MIPNDPVMLLSYVNTQLRDYYSSLDALCEDKGIEKDPGSMDSKELAIAACKILEA